MRSIKLVLIAALLASTASSAWARPFIDAKQLLGKPSAADVTYAEVDGSKLTLDVYLPRDENKARPLIVWIHGGGWRVGDKDLCPVAWMTIQGYAVASINYRLSNVAVFPAQLHDCKAAIRYLRAHANDYGIDPARIGVIGASAGGHLAALLGTTAGNKELEGEVGGNLDQGSEVAAVCDLFGPTDLVSYLRALPMDSRQRHDNLVYRLLGGDLKNKRHEAEEGSPLLQVDEHDAPFLILHGTKDPLVPLAQSRAIDRALRKAGVASELRVIPGAGHGGKEFVSLEVEQAISKFFEKHLKSS